MKIYITGIAGLLGSNLAKYFIRYGYTVIGCDNFSGGYEDNIPKQDIHDWKKIDILDLTSLSEHMSESDIVLHCAALPYEGLSVFSPKLITENIYSGTVSVMTAAIKNKVKLFINCSSMARYGKGELPFREKNQCNPVDPYGLSKFQAEQAINLLSDIHKTKVVHIVPHNIIGPGQRYTDPFRNVAAIMTNRLLQGKSVIIYGDGTQKRSFSDIDDCVLAVHKIIQFKDEIENKEVFNIGPDSNEISILDLANTVGRAVEIYPQIEFFPDRPQEVKYAFCSSSKARSKLNYQPNLNTEASVQKLAKWIKNRGARPFDYHLPIEIITLYTPQTWTEKLI